VTSRPTRRNVAGVTYLALQKKARTEGRPTDELLQLHALECYLDRITTSEVAENLVLKGGVLLAAYDLRRPTRDIDLSASRLRNDETAVLALAAMIQSESRDDGWVFGTATHESIRDEDEYSGSRLTIPCELASARLSFHVDVNFGDPIRPAAQEVIVPRLLGGSIAVRGYPLPMVHAEKLVTMLQRGVANTRWRDFADVLLLSSRHAIEGAELLESLRMVADSRKAPFAPLTYALEGLDEIAQTRWSAWVRKMRMRDRLPDSFREVLDAIHRFADPVLGGQVSTARWHPNTRSWSGLADR
jgi:hypothetical protein